MSIPTLKHNKLCKGKLDYGTKRERKEVLGRQKLDLIPIDFDIFLGTLRMWGFHDKCSWRITPKNNVSFTRSMILLSIWIDISSVCLLWRGLRTIKCDFLKLMDSLFARHHWVNLSISEFKISGSNLKSLWEKNVFVSSAKRIKSTTFDTLHRSFI